MKMLSAIVVTVLFNFASVYSQDSKVLVATIDGAISPVTSSYIEAAIKKAESDNYECLIVKLNTPGGLLKSTRVIVSEFLQSKVPIVVYVSPSGSQAASAGVFITLAAHIAVMSPGTNIGAAHPVGLQGQQDSVMIEKATNDAAAFIRSITEKRKRNVEWAEDAVRKSLSITEEEALNINVIDFISPDIRKILELIDGKIIETGIGEVTLNTRSAKIDYRDMTFAEKFLNVISDPNIAYILFILGIYGLIFELYNPGAIFPGVIGVISLILAFYALHTLPVNYAGLALIIFGIIFFLLEIKVTSYGLLSVGGAISLVLGSIMLYDPESTLEGISISMEIIIFIAVITALFFIFAVGMGIRAQKVKQTSGAEGMIGEIGESLTELNPGGLVRVHGETWQAECIDGILGKGEKIKIIEVHNLKLKVSKAG